VKAFQLARKHGVLVVAAQLTSPCGPPDAAPHCSLLLGLFTRCGARVSYRARPRSCLLLERCLVRACLVTRGKRESLLLCRRCCSRWLQLAGMLTLARVRAGQHREAREPARVQGGDGGAAGPRDRDRAAEAAAGGHVRRHLQLPHQAVRGRAGPGRGAPPSATPVLGHKP